MKKVIFALAAVVALAACSQEDVIVADKGAAIGFDTFVENSTRSVYDPSYTNAKPFANFGVFGTVSKSGTALIFNNVEVTGEGVGANANWSYAPEFTQYWIADAKYNFAAVAPQTVKVDGVDTPVYTNASYSVTSSEVENKIVYTGTTTLSFANNGKIDLLYAEATAEGKAGSGNAERSANGKVGFNFRHVLSKVKFSFKNEYNASNATIRVENVKITDAYKTADAVLNAATNWSNQATAQDFVLDFGNAAVESATAKEPFANGGTVESYNELLMIPGAGATTYTINGVESQVYTITFDVVLLVSGKEIDKYEHTIYTTFVPEAGMRYNLKAVIKPENIDPEHSQEPILFTVNEINDWDNGNTKDSDDTDTENDYYPLK